MGSIKLYHFTDCKTSDIIGQTRTNTGGVVTVYTVLCIYCKVRKNTYVQPCVNAVLCRRQTTNGLHAVTVSTKSVNSNQEETYYETANKNIFLAFSR